jgi:hypothetical protein
MHANLSEKLKGRDNMKDLGIPGKGKGVPLCNKVPHHKAISIA